MVTRQQDIDEEGFQVRLQAEEAASVPGSEQVSWFAIDTIDGPLRYVSTTGNTMDHNPRTIEFGSHNEGQPAFFAAMQSFNGPDTATLRYTSLTNEGVDVKVEEEQSAN
jgi:hypothetical protein